MTTSPLRLIYAFDNRVPSPQADTEQLVSSLSALSRRNLDITLLIPALGAELDGESIRQFYGTSGRFGVARYAPLRHPRVGQKLYAALRVSFSDMARQADILYTRNLPIAVAATARGLPVVFESYRPWPDQYPALSPVIRKLTRSSHFVAGVFHSDLARDSHIRAGAPAERLLVAHNGFEPRRMEPVLTIGEARQKVGLDAESPTVVYTGRVSDGKGLETVLGLASRCPSVRFVLVGATGEDPFEVTANAVPNVSLAPWQSYDAVSDWLYAADVLIVPPSSGPLERHGHTVLPIKLFSYLAAGRAILGPSTPDVRELLTDGENAALVPPGDLDAAATALSRLLADQAFREGLAGKALEQSKGLTWDVRASRIHDFLLERLVIRATEEPMLVPAPSGGPTKPDRGPK